MSARGGSRRRIVAILLAGLAVLLALALTPTPQYVSTKEPIPVPEKAESLWAYLGQCSGVPELPGHGLRDVVWYKDSLLLYDFSKRGLVALYQWRSQRPNGPGPDTIILDVWHTQVPRFIAHELLHHREAKYDTSGVHPFVPWVKPCDLIVRPRSQPR